MKPEMPAQPAAERQREEPKLPPLEVGTTTLVETQYAGQAYHYRCYVPRSLKPGEPIVVVLNTSPVGEAEPLSTRMAEKLGWVMVGLVEARNGPGEPVYNNMVSTVQDLAQRYEIRPRGLVFSGFSGGARASFFFAKRFGDLCSGIVAIGAGSSGTPGTLRDDIPVFFIAGKSDFNRAEVAQEAEREEKAGRACELATHPGGHEWGPAKLHDEALAWLAEHLP